MLHGSCCCVHGATVAGVDPSVRFVNCGIIVWYVLCQHCIVGVLLRRASFIQYAVVSAVVVVCACAVCAASAVQYAAL